MIGVTAAVDSVGVVGAEECTQVHLLCHGYSTSDVKTARKENRLDAVKEVCIIGCLYAQPFRLLVCEIGGRMEEWQSCCN